MKSTELKNMIKDAVKEAIQEELKDILLEAIRAPKGSVAVMQEAQTPVNPQPNVIPTQSSTTSKNGRALYEQALNETTLNFNSSNASTFQPQTGYDSANGTLPSGEVNMDMITGLMNKR